MLSSPLWSALWSEVLMAVRKWSYIRPSHTAPPWPAQTQGFSWTSLCHLLQLVASFYFILFFRYNAFENSQEPDCILSQQEYDGVPDGVYGRT